MIPHPSVCVVLCPAKFIVVVGAPLEREAKGAAVDGGYEGARDYRPV